MKFADVLAALAIVVIWGINFVVVKVGVGLIPPLFMTALRLTLVAGILIWFGRPPVGRMARIAVLSVTFGGLHFGAMFSGLVGVDAAVSAIVMQLGVPFSVLLARLLLGEQFGGRRAVGMAIAFSGVVILAGEPRTASGLGYLALILLAAFAWGLGNIQIKKIGRINVFTLNAWMALFAAPQLMLASAFLEEGQVEAALAAGWLGWGAVLYTVFAASITAYGLWYYLVEKYEIGKVVPFTLLSPVIGVLAGVLLLGEAPTWEMAIGGVVTILGVAIIQLRIKETYHGAA